MSHRHRLGAALTLVTAPALAACGTGSSGGQVTGTAAEDEIVIGSTDEPTGMVRNVGGSSGVSQTMTRNIHEGLTSVDVDGTVIPTLAHSWDVSEDGRTCTFHLQPGVTFHDGAALAAQDVVWSVAEVIGPESKTARRSDLEVITTVTAVDGPTVEMDLSRPSQGLTFYLASITVVQDGDTELTADNGTGPYRFVEWVQDGHLTIERNDDHWGGPAQNSGVTFRFFSDTTALNNALYTGDLDLVIAEDSPDQLAQLEDDPDFTITAGTSTTKQIWAFDDRDAPFDDVRVRQALHQAIDREAILALLTKNLAAVGVRLTPDPIDDATWYQRVYTDHDFETTLMGHVNPRDVLWYANPDFYWGYDNAQVQEWVTQADEASTEDEQVALLTRVNETIGEEAASTWLYLEPQIRVARAGITGFPMDQVTESFHVADIVREP